MTFGDSQAWNLHGVSQIDLLEWLATWKRIQTPAGFLSACTYYDKAAR